MKAHSEHPGNPLLKQFGVFATTRRSLLLISGTAIVLLLWLSLSFWVDAWIQRSDAATMKQGLALENRLFSAARLVAAERLDTAALLTSDPANETHVSALSSNIRDARAALNSNVERLLGLPLIDKPESPISLNPVQAQLLQNPFKELLAIRKKVDQSVQARQIFNPELAKQAFAAFGDLVDNLMLARDDSRARSYKGDITLDRLLQLRTKTWRLKEAVSQSAALAIAQLNSTNDQDRQTYAAQVAASKTADLSWQHFKVIAVTAEIDSSLDEALQLVKQMYEDRFVPAREVLLLPAATDNPSMSLETWVSISQQTLNAINAVDSQLHARAEDYLKGVVAHAVRRLIIDTALILVCMLLVLASLKLLAAIRFQATHDRLTSLPNRQEFEHQLAIHVQRSRKAQVPLTLMYFDIHQLSQINDSLGHEIGDCLLQVVGQRLKQFASATEMTSRMDGDEFAVLVQAPPVDTANRLIELLTDNININGLDLALDVNVGVAGLPSNSIDCHEFLNNAIIAMFDSKKSAGCSVSYFDEDMAARFRERAACERDLAVATVRNELCLHYQPQVDSASGRVSGLEALVRWNHPQRGMVSPGLFIPIAEDSGIIHQIGPWVLDEACRQAAVWQREIGFDGRIAVNISARQFALDDFTDTVMQALERHSLAARHLEIEVTESVVMTDLNPVIERLTCLRKQGIKIAIDDFGTGYSSLSYLDKLPLDCLKIDRAFVQRLEEGSPRDSLLHKIQSLATSFNLETVVEGVETFEQLAIVTELGCNIVQGYVYAKPVAADQVPEIINQIEAANFKRAA